MMTLFLHLQVLRSKQKEGEEREGGREGGGIELLALLEKRTRKLGKRVVYTGYIYHSSFSLSM